MAGENRGEKSVMVQDVSMSWGVAEGHEHNSMQKKLIEMTFRDQLSICRQR